MSSTVRIGLTGGIGSGKTSVAAMFAELDVPVLDLDKVAREVVSPGSRALSQLIEVFGIEMLHADGTLNRKLMAEHCFNSAENTERLNAIMHPLIWQAEAKWLKQQEGAYVIIEASVLLESGAADRMDAVIVVLASMSLRQQRVMQRGDRGIESFQAIVKRQCGDDLRREKASYIIENNSSLKQLKEQVLQLHREISATL